MLTAVLPIIGLVVLYSAGYDLEAPSSTLSWLPFQFFSTASAKQGIYFLMGLAAMVVGMTIPTNFIQRYAYVIYIVAITLLVLVLSVGNVVNGSRRWLSFGGFNLQPAELMKLGVIFAIAKFGTRSPPRRHSGYSIFELILPSLIIILPMVLIAKQPDLGSALALGAVGYAMILFIGVRTRTILSIVFSFLVFAYPVWHRLHDYQQRRILVLFNPEIDPQGSGYHIIQSKIAVGSGAVFGKGFLRGTQTQLEFLPEHTTDFIFSVLAEEWGFAGCIFIIGLFALLVLSILRVAHRSRDMFGTLVAFGITTQFFLHVSINIGMVLGLMPVVGIPLPLFSYGGSSLITLMFALGVVQGISMRRTMFHER